MDGFCCHLGVVWIRHVATNRHAAANYICGHHVPRGGVLIDTVVSVVAAVVAIAVVEGIGRQLDPELDLLREAGPFLARAVVKGAREGW